MLHRGLFGFLNDMLNLFVFGCCLCSWLHGLIDTYAEPNADKAEVHLPMGMKSDEHTINMNGVSCGNTDLHPVSSTWFNTVWHVASHIWKCASSTGERMHKPGWLCSVLSGVSCQNMLTLFFCMSYCRFAVCERCTEIDITCISCGLVQRSTGNMWALFDNIPCTRFH